MTRKKKPAVEMVRIPRAYLLNAIQALTTRPEFVNQRIVVALVEELSKIANPEIHRAEVESQKRAVAAAKKKVTKKKVTKKKR